MCPECGCQYKQLTRYKQNPSVDGVGLYGKERGWEVGGWVVRWDGIGMYVLRRFQMYSFGQEVHQHI